MLLYYEFLSLKILRMLFITGKRVKMSLELPGLPMSSERTVEHITHCVDVSNQLNFR